MFDLRSWAMVVTVLLAASVSGSAYAQTVLTVVFESGLGDGAGVWRKTIDGLGEAVPVFAYDRPGYGRTPASTAPRDPCTIATELHARLQVAGKAPPYILIGHSLGGQYAYAFARLFPQDMAGLVLVDATPIGHLHALQDTMPAAVGVLKMMKAIAFSSTMRREFNGQDQCLAGLPQTAMAFPVRVLVRTKGDTIGGERLLQIDRDMAGTWLTTTGANRIEAVSGTGHYIQRDRPSALVEVILQIAKR